MADPGFWDNRERAQREVAEVSALRGKINPLQTLEARLADLDILKELAAEEEAAADFEIAELFDDIGSAAMDDDDLAPATAPEANADAERVDEA